MKKFIIPALLISFLLISCNEDWLEVKPSDRLSEANFYQDEDHGIRAITACYDPLKHPRGFPLNFHFVFETFSDRALHERINLNNMIVSPGFDRAYDMWVNLYQGVYRCNQAIEKIAGLHGNPGIAMNEQLKERLIGEAMYLRGMYYYYLVKIFGNPALITQTQDDLNIRLTNASQAELFAFIEENLKGAIERLPDTYDSANRGRATRGAARTVLGKAYMYQHKFAEAREIFKIIIDSEVYELMLPLGNDSVDFTAAFQANFTGDDIVTPTGNTYRSENNRESIFEIQFHTGGWEVWEGGWQADGHLLTLFFGPEGYRNMVPTADYVNMFEEAPENHPAGIRYDPRKYVTFYLPGDSIFYVNNVKAGRRWINGVHTNASISQGFGWGKYFKPTFWSDATDLNNDYNNHRILRFSEVLLLFAEADLLATGGTAEGLNALNRVRARAGMPARAQLTKEYVIFERDIEFGFEVKRYWDLVRWSKYPSPWVNITEILPVYNPARQGFMPIPQREIDLSEGSLKQNPGY